MSTEKDHAKKVKANIKSTASSEAIAAHALDKKRIDALRIHARTHFGPRCLRVVASGEVHAYSRMPNSIETGWWLVGRDAKEACERVFGPDSTLA